MTTRTERTPFRDRPDSYLRGFVLGSAVGGWVCVLLSVLLMLVTNVDKLAMLGVTIPVVFLALFATFLWRYG